MVTYSVAGGTTGARLEGEDRFVAVSMHLVAKNNPAMQLNWHLILDTTTRHLSIQRSILGKHPIRYDRQNWGMGDLTLSWESLPPDQH